MKSWFCCNERSIGKWPAEVQKANDPLTKAFREFQSRLKEMRGGFIVALKKLKVSLDYFLDWEISGMALKLGRL